MTRTHSPSSLLTLALAPAAFLLAGCQGSVTLDLNADAPANPQVSSVPADIAGVEFQRADGGTEKLEFTSSLQTDLIDVMDNDAVRLFTDESLPEGSYTGVRLLVDENDGAEVLRFDGTRFPLRVAEATYAPVAINVTEDESTRESLALTLDLRRSLSFNTDDNEYTLTPALRVVRADEAGQISGSIATACPFGTSMQTGGAVYLFEGEDVEADDIGGAGTEPYATTAVITDFAQFTYSLRFLPPGDYTLALTCNGNIDEPATDEDVTFIRAANVTVDTDTVTYDFTN